MELYIQKQKQKQKQNYVDFSKFYNNYIKMNNAIKQNGGAVNTIQVQIIYYFLYGDVHSRYIYEENDSANPLVLVTPTGKEYTMIKIDDKTASVYIEVNPNEFFRFKFKRNGLTEFLDSDPVLHLHYKPSDIEIKTKYNCASRWRWIFPTEMDDDEMFCFSFYLPRINDFNWSNQIDKDIFITSFQRPYLLFYNLGHNVTTLKAAEIVELILSKFGMPIGGNFLHIFNMYLCVSCMNENFILKLEHIDTQMNHVHNSFTNIKVLIEKMQDKTNDHKEFFDDLTAKKFNYIPPTGDPNAHCLDEWPKSSAIHTKGADKMMSLEITVVAYPISVSKQNYEEITAEFNIKGKIVKITITSNVNIIAKGPYTDSIYAITQEISQIEHKIFKYCSGKNKNIYCSFRNNYNNENYKYVSKLIVISFLRKFFNVTTVVESSFGIKVEINGKDEPNFLIDTTFKDIRAYATSARIFTDADMFDQTVVTTYVANTVNVWAHPDDLKNNKLLSDVNSDYICSANWIATNILSLHFEVAYTDDSVQSVKPVTGTGTVTSPISKIHDNIEGARQIKDALTMATDFSYEYADLVAGNHVITMNKSLFIITDDKVNVTVTMGDTHPSKNLIRTPVPFVNLFLNNLLGRLDDLHVAHNRVSDELDVICVLLKNVWNHKKGVFVYANSTEHDINIAVCDALYIFKKHINIIKNNFWTNLTPLNVSSFVNLMSVNERKIAFFKVMYAALELQKIIRTPKHALSGRYNMNNPLHLRMTECEYIHFLDKNTHFLKLFGMRRTKIIQNIVPGIKINKHIDDKAMDWMKTQMLRDASFKPTHESDSDFGDPAKVCEYEAEFETDTGNKPIKFEQALAATYTLLQFPEVTNKIGNTLTDSQQLYASYRVRPE